MIPHYPPVRIRGTLHRKLVQGWIRWFCIVEPYIGWVVPAVVKGVQLCSQHRLGVVIATVPSFSALIAGAIISRISAAQLIIDKMTSLNYPIPPEVTQLLSQ